MTNKLYRYAIQFVLLSEKNFFERRVTAMALFTIADLHLPLGIDKPMDVFGRMWENYVERLADNWQSVVAPDDTVVIPGDFSWATYIEQSEKDFDYLNNLNGIKILLKGNHDYWWTTMSKLNKFVSKYDNVSFLQNNAFMYKNTAICGTRGWNFPGTASFSAEDGKIYARELQRLELSLNASKAYSPDEIIVFTHYPPIGRNAYMTSFAKILEEWNVKMCIYGHLHAASHQNAVEGVINGVEYRLVSSDYVQFKPVKLME